MQPLCNFGDFLPRPVMAVDRLLRARSQLGKTLRKPQHRVISGLGIDRQNRFQFQAEFRPPHFAPPTDVAHVFAQQVAGNSQQPRSNQCIGIEPGAGLEKPDENLLSHVLGVDGCHDPCPKVTENRPLMPFEQRRKRVSIAGAQSDNQIAIGNTHEHTTAEVFTADQTRNARRKRDNANTHQILTRPLSRQSALDLTAVVPCGATAAEELSRAARAAPDFKSAAPQVTLRRLATVFLRERSVMTAILGISAFYHDSAAALVVDGHIVAAAQEERFTRIKHDAAFPQHAVNYCLREARLTAADLDFVCFYEKPLLKFERLLETYLAYAPIGLRSFTAALPVWLKQKLFLKRELDRGLNRQYHRRYVYLEHHESHAASAFFPSPYESAAILTVDGVGEWATATFGVGEGRRIRLTHELRFPHSPGMLYTAFTYFCGFKVNSGEYKLMGLAPYGEPRYADLIRDKLVDIKPDGSFRLNMDYFNYCQGLTMTSRRFEQLFGGPPRKPEAPLTQREMDLAASVQVVTEEILLQMVRHIHEQTGQKNLCLAGGVALNCVANGRILREGPFESLWIQPAAGDAGGALGAALFCWHQLLDKPRAPQPTDLQSGSLLGPAFTDNEVQKYLDRVGAKYQRFTDDDELCQHVAQLIADEHVIGWVQGRMEFGPRALGCRSIVGDARSAAMQSAMNLKTKFRESFRPFAPSVLANKAHEHFELPPETPSPYMLLVAPVRSEFRRELGEAEQSRVGIDKLKTVRSHLPAITHVDYSARIQTVDAERHGRYYVLLEAFESLTGSPVVINTSFNVRGEPIVCTPEDAYRCFLATNMDALVLERFVLRKADQPQLSPEEVQAYLARFKLD